MLYSVNGSKHISRLRVSLSMTTNCRRTASILLNVRSLVLLAPVGIFSVAQTIRQRQKSRSRFASRFYCSHGSHFTRELGISLQWVWGKHVRYSRDNR